MKPFQSRKSAGRRLLPALLSATLLVGAAAAHAQAPLAVRHTAPALSQAQLVGHTSAARTLPLTLVLPLRNRAMLDTLLARISDPKDVLYGHYLSPEEFAQRFGPEQADVDAVSAFARTHGLTVKDVSPDLTLVHVTGPASAVEAAFGVHVNDYVGADGRAFFAADREPTVPAAVASRLLSVLGLSNAQRPHTFSRRASATPLLDYYNGNAGLAPADVKNIYGLTGTAFTGTGQVAGLFEVGTFTQSDITTYDTTYGVNVPVNPVSVDGYSTTSAPGGAAAEVTLDIDMFQALAPGLSQIRVYEATDDQNANFTTELVDSFTAMANETTANRPNVISVSYGESEVYEAAADYQALDQATAHLASQGQTICVSSGDAGAYTDQSAGAKPNASFPADDPYVLCVGGTDLNDGYDANGNCTYLSETSWSDTADTGRGPIGTGGGGGYSAYFPFPTYQSGSFTAAGNPQGSMSKRNVPDVSLYGDYDTGGYDVYFSDPNFGPGWGGYNGTSASSPLWAAFLADVNQARAAKSQAAIGFSNPAIYQQAESSSYATLFHDIADGSNNLFYKAVKGYDNSTGWGSFIGSKLLTALSAVAASAPTITSFTPASGPVGTSITINGTSFAGATSVKIDGTAATFTVNSATKITATVAAGTATGAITVATPGGAATSATSFTVTAAPAPTITSFTPASGPVGTSVTINGTGFAGTSGVTIGGTAATFTVYGTTKVVAKVATGTASGAITVTTPGGTVTSASAFTVTGAGAKSPTITSFSPTSGPVGTSVTLTGTNFTGATAVKIGGTAATFTVNSATQITLTVAAGTATGTITVTTPGGTATSATAFTVTASPAPTITSFTPASGPVGTSVTINGTGFAGATSVKIGGTAATFTVNSATKITATVAAGTATGAITVATPGGAATSATSFTVTAASAPTITSFTPASGPVGTSVTINGTGFAGTSGVTIGGTAATFTVYGTTKVVAKVATGTASGAITVTTSAGTATSSASFTVTIPPTITGFTPTSSPVGTSVLVNGTNLNAVSGVKFGGVAAVTFAANSNTQIQVIVPSGAVTGKITVTTPGGTVTSSGTYTVTSAAATLSTFAFNPNPGFSSGLSQGTVTLSGPAPTGGASVAITNNGNTLATVVIPAGQTTGSYTQTLPTVTASTAYPIAATYNGTTVNVSLVVNPTSVTLSGFSLSPNPVASGGTITATATLSAAAPAGGAAVTITQGGTTLGYVPVTAGSTSVTFSLAAPTESTPTTVAYTAAYNGASMAVNETVN